MPLGPTPSHRSRQHLPQKIQRAWQVLGRGQQWRTLTHSRDVRHAAAAAAAFAGAASGPAAAPPLATIGAAAIAAAAALCHPSAPRACSLLDVAHVVHVHAGRIGLLSALSHTRSARPRLCRGGWVQIPCVAPRGHVVPTRVRRYAAAARPRTRDRYAGPRALLTALVRLSFRRAGARSP